MDGRNNENIRLKKLIKKSGGKFKKQKHIHKNKYEAYSQAGEGYFEREFLSDNLLNHDYFGVDKSKKQGFLSVSSRNSESSITSLKYDLKKDIYGNGLDRPYSVTFRKSSRVHKKNIDDFFDLAAVGNKEKAELNAIKRLIEPLIEKLGKKD